MLLNKKFSQSSMEKHSNSKKEGKLPTNSILRTNRQNKWHQIGQSKSQLYKVTDIYRWTIMIVMRLKNLVRQNKTYKIDFIWKTKEKKINNMNWDQDIKALMFLVSVIIIKTVIEE